MFRSTASRRRPGSLSPRPSALTLAFVVSFALADASRAAGPWVPRTDSPNARTNSAAVVANDGSSDKIFVLGGGQSSGVASMDAYDPVSDSWTARAPMPTARAALTAVTYIDGDVYAIAGSNSGGQKMERYDPVANTWHAAPDLPFPPRMSASAAVAQDASGTWNIYVTGGLQSGAGTSLQRVDYWSSAVGFWQSSAPMLVKRHRHQAVAAGGKIYVFGGGDPRIEVYDPVLDSWSFTGVSTPSSTYFHNYSAALASNGWIYLVGGLTTITGVGDCSNQPTATLRYHPGSNVLLPGPSLCEGRTSSVTVRHGSCLYTIGGYRHAPCSYADRFVERVCFSGRFIAVEAARAIDLVELNGGTPGGPAVIGPFVHTIELDGREIEDFQRLTLTVESNEPNVSLDGLPPGEPVTRVVSVAPGERVCCVETEWKICEGEVGRRGSGSIRVLGDLDQDGEAELIAETFFRGESCREVEYEANATMIDVEHDSIRVDLPEWPEGARLPVVLAESTSGEHHVFSPERLPFESSLELDPGEWLVSVRRQGCDCDDSDTWIAGLSVIVSTPSAFRRGDANLDGGVDLGDSVSILGYLFLGRSLGGCDDAADVNDDSRIDLGDAISGLNWQFLGGRIPPAPGPFECGEDPTEDTLDCQAVSSCQ